MPMRRPDLTPQQNESVRAIARRLLADAGGNQSALAKSLGITQPGIAAFLQAQKGASMKLARQIAARAGMDLEDALRADPVNAATASPPPPGVRMPRHEPAFRDVPGWEVAVARARAAAPEIPDWVWDQLGRSVAFPRPPLTTAYLRRMAEIVRDFSTPE